MWVEQLCSDDDVAAQMEALRALSIHPTHNGAYALPFFLSLPFSHVLYCAVSCRAVPWRAVPCCCCAVAVLLLCCCCVMRVLLLCRTCALPLGACRVYDAGAWYGCVRRGRQQRCGKHSGGKEASVQCHPRLSLGARRWEPGELAACS
jgi:hypothetical protein